MKKSVACLAGVAAIAASGAPPAIGRSAVGVQHTQLGDLICDVGRSSEESSSVEATAIPSIKQEIYCVLRNTETGAAETYRGDFRMVGSLASVPHKSTLLWEVSVAPGTKLTAGVLEQSYEAQPSKINKTRVKVRGEAKPGVSLRLITDESGDKPALPVLSLKLNLVSSSA